MEKSGRMQSETFEQACQRSNIYAFLATVYRKELTSDLLNQIKDPRFMGVLAVMGVQLGEEFISIPDEKLFETLLSTPGFF